MKTAQGSFLVWFDTEYTSLDLEEAQLIQVAMVITDMQGQRVASPEQDFVSAVRLPQDRPVSDFLARECPSLVLQARAGNAPAVEMVDEALANRIDALCGPVAAKIGDRPVLAGNSIHADWWLAHHFLPRFLSRLHYRQLDVSSLKLLWLASGSGLEFDKGNVAQVRDYLPGWNVPSQPKRHDALYDVMCSLAELNFYRRHFIKPEVTQVRPGS
jgi:oligoribonuclease